MGRAEGGESKIVDLEEELRVIGENLKALEVAEEKAQQREEEYKKQIKVLMERLKTDESRAEYGEKTVQKLNLRVDSIITELVFEMMKWTRPSSCSSTIKFSLFDVFSSISFFC